MMIFPGFKMRSVWCFAVVSFLYTTVVADFKPKRYTVDLNLEPSQRWNEIIQDHLDAIPLVAAESKAYIPSIFQPFVWWFAAQVSRFFSQEIAEELKGISRESGLPLGEVVGMNILYDILAFDRRHVFGLGCTSIVAEDGKGRIFHGRNLDYEMGDLLKNITVIVDFKKNGKILYSGTTFALYNGLLTGQKPHAYTVSLNARYSGAYIDNILMELYTKFRRPVSCFIREVLETVTSFDEAVDAFALTPLVSPSYIIVGGMKSGQGAVISRSRLKAADVYRLTPRRWFLVETNFDHWKQDHDQRRITAIRALTKTGQSHFTSDVMMNILSTEPVNNNLTIYSTVLSARYPGLMAKSFLVRD